MSDVLGRMHEQSPRVAKVLVRLKEDLIREGVEPAEAREVAESMVARAVIYDALEIIEQEPWE